MSSVNFNYVFLLFFVFVLAFFAWRYFRSGSFTGAMLGGRIKREVGQVALTSSAVSSQNLKVHAMESHTGEPFVGLALISKAPMAISMMPIKLSRVQAQDLVRLIQQAMV